MKTLPEGWERVHHGWRRVFPADTNGHRAYATITKRRERRWTYLCHYYAAIGSKRTHRLVEDAMADVEAKHAELEREGVTG